MLFDIIVSFTLCAMLFYILHLRDKCKELINNHNIMREVMMKYEKTLYAVCNVILKNENNYDESENENE